MKPRLQKGYGVFTLCHSQAPRCIVGYLKTINSFTSRGGLRTATLQSSESLGGNSLRSNAELEQQLQEQARQLRALARRLMAVEQQERERLSAILHDHVQQLLLSARLQLSLVNQDALPRAECKALATAEAALGVAMQDCRSLAVDLSPPILHQAGLGAALEWLARRMGEQHRFTVHLDIDHQAEPLADLRDFLFGATRELLLNSCKHSGCTSAHMSLSREPNDWIRIVIEDAGKGFDPDRLNSGGDGLGLVSIRQRLAHLGARMELESIPGKVTRIAILAHTHSGDRRNVLGVAPDFKRQMRSVSA